MRRLCDVHIRVKDDVMLRFNLTLAWMVLKTEALAVSNIDHRPTLDTNRYVKCKGANYRRKRATKCWHNHLLYEWNVFKNAHCMFRACFPESFKQVRPENDLDWSIDFGLLLNRDKTLRRHSEAGKYIYCAFGCQVSLKRCYDWGRCFMALGDVGWSFHNSHGFETESRLSESDILSPFFGSWRNNEYLVVRQTLSLTRTRTRIYITHSHTISFNVFSFTFRAYFLFYQAVWSLARICNKSLVLALHS